MAHLTQEAVISLAIGYAFGLILLGYFLGRLSHVDIRKLGSGNVGTTNATRVLGWKKGLLTLLCDVGKGFAAAGVVWLLFHGREPITAEELRLLMVYAAFGAILGHDFPIYMKFRGGKGVATSLSFLVVVNPRIALATALVFVVTVLITHYVSLGSILGDGIATCMAFLWGGLDFYQTEDWVHREAAVLFGIAAAILLIKHHANIGRLIRGEENRLELKKKP